MRIWILNHYASPPDRPAGTRHYEFGRVLAAQGHDVTIFASSFSHFSRREERLIPGERMKSKAWTESGSSGSALPLTCAMITAGC